MRNTPLLAVAAVAMAMALSATPLAAQKTGVIAGKVLDDAGNPLAGADVVASAENARTRSDSAGNFEIKGLDDDSYTVRARHIGFISASLTVDISKGGRAVVKFELKARPAMLDSVVIIANGNCPDRSYVGFLCRRKGGKGVYYTDEDIFDKNVREVGEIFRGLPGFRVELRQTPFGRLPVPLPTRGSMCLNALVNGRVSAPANPIPRFADEIIAIEIYTLPSEVPEEYQRFVWGRQGRQTQMMLQDHGSQTERCSLVAYWTRFT